MTSILHAPPNRDASSVSAETRSSSTKPTELRSAPLPSARLSRIHGRDFSNVRVHSNASSGPIIQRKCACGGEVTGDGECAECRKKRLQTKLAVGSANDSFEREADRIAEHVISGPSHAQAPESHSSIAVQRVANSSDSGMKDAPSSVNRVLQDPGRALDTPVRRDMENRFGHDFSHVRVHTGNAADTAARDVNARAYTTGHNMVFADGEYSPSEISGRRLIAHELTHVLQQSGSKDRPFLQRSAKVAGCGFLNLAGSITGIGSAAHVQIQAYLAAKGITPEFFIPRATKLSPGWGCRKEGTEPGFADLAKPGPLGYDLAEIKPVTMGGRARAKIEVAHYRRRAAQSMQRLFKTGSCGRRPAGFDDIAFGTRIGATPVTGFSMISGALMGDETIGPFSGDPSLTLKAKEISAGAVCYWCTKGQSQQQPPAKPPGPNVGFGISIGGSSGGAYNAGVGVSIMSDSTAYGTAGAGISYKSDTKAAGAVGAGASIESDSIAAGAAGAGASKDTQSIGAGVAGAGASEGSVSAAAGAAGAGTSTDSATAGAGVAGQGSVKDSAVAGAGSTGSGKIENVQGTGTGSPGKPIDAKDTEGGGKSPTPKSETAEGKPGDKPTGHDEKAGEGVSSKGEKTGVAAGTTGGSKPGDGPAKDEATEKGSGSSSGSGHGGSTESAAAKGAQGAKEAGPDPGTGTESSGQKSGASGTKTDSTAKGPGDVAKVAGLGVAPVVGFPSTEADRKKAAEESVKVAQLLSKAAPAQIALFRYVAQSSPNGQYVVPASQWVDTMMKAVEGLSEADIEYLKSLNWTPGHLSAEELRKKVLEVLKEKKPPSTGGASKDAAADADHKEAKKGKGDGGSGAAGKGSGSGGGAKGSEKGPALSPYRKGRKYTGDISAVNDAGFQIQPDDKQITMKTKVGTKVTLEVRWLADSGMDRALAEYEVVAGPTVDHDPNSEKQFWRFDLKSTNTDPIVLSPEGAAKATVLPAHAPASYYMIKKK